MIYLFNNNEEMIRIIPNSAIKRLYQTQTLTDENYISDRLDVEIQALNDEELSELEYMAIDDIENPQRFHYYFIVKETTEHQITSLTGVQSGIEELRKTPVYDMRPTNRSPKFIADRLLEGTNWQAGYTTDDVGTISTNFYYTDVFSALKKMCMAFGIEMQFFVEITTNRIGARYIEFRKRTGKSVGKRVVYGHNALKIIKEVEKTNTVTALIGRGKGVQVSESDEGDIGYGRKIGFENVEWKTSSGAPVDKPLGQEFVEIPELTLQYGIKNSNGTVRPKIGFVEFQDEESETRLIDRTYNALLELSRPQVLLETSSVYLPDTGIGDTINVVRHDRDLRYQTRVFEITWDRLANQAVDMKLGDRLGESENKRISRISNQVSGNISTELGPTIDELVDRLTTADGKNTNWYTDYDPMENPETMGLVRVNDNWWQPDPEFEGEFILKQWNGEMWVEILRTSGNPELVRRFEEIEKQANDLESNVATNKERTDSLFQEWETMKEDFNYDGLENSFINIIGDDGRWIYSDNRLYEQGQDTTQATSDKVVLTLEEMEKVFSHNGEGFSIGNEYTFSFANPTFVERPNSVLTVSFEPSVQHDVHISLVSERPQYPNYNQTISSGSGVFNKAYHDDYTVSVSSEWYLPVIENITVDKAQIVTLPLVYRDGSLTINHNDTNISIDGEVIENNLSDVTLPYKATAYAITATKKYHHSETKEVSINPTTPNQTIDFNLIRKTGDWVSTQYTEPEPFETDVVNDVNVRPENSYVDTVGVNGVRTFTEEREWIDNEWTGEWRNRSSQVTTAPVTQVEINGTAVIEWRDKSRTETIPFESETYHSSDYYEDETVVTTEGVNGYRVYVWEEEYMNNVNTGSKTAETVSQFVPPVTKRTAIGTKIRSILSRDITIGSSSGYFKWITQPDESKMYTIHIIGGSGTETIRFATPTGASTDLTVTNKRIRIPANGSVMVEGRDLLPAYSLYTDGMKWGLGEIDYTIAIEEVV